MIESLINVIFSIPYLLSGVVIAIALDYFIHKSKATTRLTFLEIWGCVMFWPVLLLLVVMVYIIGEV